MLGQQVFLFVRKIMNQILIKNCGWKWRRLVVFREDEKEIEPSNYSRIFYPKPARVENFSFQIDITFVLVNFLEKDLRNRQF